MQSGRSPFLANILPLQNVQTNISGQGVQQTMQTNIVALQSAVKILQTSVASLQTAVTELKTSLKGLDARITALEG